MKNRSPRSQTTAIPNSRWVAYAAAGAASAFAAVNSAEATIHYSGIINETFTGNSAASFQLDPRGGLIEFVHKPHYYSTFSVDGGSASFHVFAPGGASCNGFYNTCAYNPEDASVSNLSRGEEISARPFVPNGGVLATHSGFDCGGGNRGQFTQAGIAYIGFKFNRGGGDQYGWARVKMHDLGGNEFKLIDYAYGDVGDRVRAGQKSSHLAPELGSLGGLAIGAAGLLAWRRRHSKVAASVQRKS